MYVPAEDEHRCYGGGVPDRAVCSFWLPVVMSVLAKEPVHPGVLRFPFLSNNQSGSSPHRSRGRVSVSLSTSVKAANFCQTCSHGIHRIFSIHDVGGCLWHFTPSKVLFSRRITKKVLLFWFGGRTCVGALCLLSCSDGVPFAS